MPVMNGRDLYTEIARALPGLAVLFISGYSEEVLSAYGPRGAPADLLPKPFSGEALRARMAEIVRRVRAAKKAPE